jgi:crotonobetainyl-CoA:carnitine CoA-transferase CaiB-like acyl-CoA transferase
VPVTLPGGIETKLPKLPIELDGERPGIYRQPPRMGEHTREILAAAGLSEREIAALEEQGVVVAPPS